MRPGDEALFVGDGNWPRDHGVVVTPLDGSPQALSALPVAEGIGQALGWVVHLLHVSERPLAPGDLLRTLHLTSEQVQGLVLDQAEGPPAGAILQKTETLHAQVVVMATRAGQTARQRTLGPIAEDVLCHVHAPLLFVRPQGRIERPWTIRHILLPHDGRPSTSAAIGPAMELARRAGAEVDVLHVAVAQRGRPSEPGSFAGPRYIDQPQHEWPAWAHEFLTRLVELGHRGEQVRIRLELGCCEPSEAIVRFATEHKSDLIVLAWRGRLDRSRASTLRGVLRHAPCPVLVLRTEAK